MKCNDFRGIVFSIGLAFCLTDAGCTAANDTDSQPVLNENDWEGEDDAMFYQSTLTYENEMKESTKAIMWDATKKLDAILAKYRN